MVSRDCFKYHPLLVDAFFKSAFKEQLLDMVNTHWKMRIVVISSPSKLLGQRKKCLYSRSIPQAE